MCIRDRDICKPVSVKCSSSGYRDWLGIVEFVLERVLFKKEVIKFTLLYLSRSLLTEHASYLCPFPLSAVLQMCIRDSHYFTGSI